MVTSAQVALDGRVEPGQDVELETPCYWFAPESFGAGIVPVTWKGIAAVVGYGAALSGLIGAGVLVYDSVPRWLIAGALTLACGLLTFGFLRFAATKTDRTQSGETNLAVPPIDPFC